MEWFEHFDFDEDPFSTDPRENHDALVKMEDLMEEVFYRINSGSILVDEGPDGHGKTTLLMAAARKFGGRKKVAYVDCRILDKKLNVTPASLEDFKPSKKYDIITLHQVFEHFRDPSGAIRKLADLLDERGTLIMSFPNNLSFAALLFGK